MRRVRSWLGGLVLIALLAPGGADAQTKLLRFPDIHGDRVVFTYAGDLWTAPSDGGTATRLTTHPGLELFAKFSPDGEWIAFTGQYDGDEQVYVMPAGGGVPKQLTYYPARGPLPPRWGYDYQVYGWTPDGSAVLFRSLRDGWDLGDSRLYTVDVAGGLPEPLPMPQSGAGAFSPDGSRVVYSPKFRDFRSWKRYGGGWAQDLWVFDLGATAVRQITDHPRADRDPMWIGDRIYFTSDRGGTLNLYAVSPGGGTPEAVTEYDTWDVRWPSDDGGRRIVFELGGELSVVDVASGAVNDLDIRVPDDLVAKRPSRIDVADNIEDYELSPAGARALFVARGDVFTAPIEHGATRTLTRSSGAHDKHARWSPDGRWIAFVSDRTGEEEIYVIAQDGTGEPRQLTSGSEMMLYVPEWSPDARKIAYSDKEGRLWVVDVESGDRRQVADEKRGQITDYTWSPRGGWLAFTLSDESGFGSVHVWSDDAGLHRVTSSYFSEFGPAWGPDGDYLYFMADRSYPPQVGSFEWNYVVDRETYVYAVALRDDVPHPFPPRSDEVEVGVEDDAEVADEEEAGSSQDGPLVIDLDGIADRTVQLPMEPGNYGGLSATKDGDLVYVALTPFYYGKSPGERPTLMLYSMTDREAETLVEGTSGYALSPDGTKLLVREAGGFQLYDASAGASGTRVSTAGLAVDRVPAEEWDQIFHEVWRRFRDWFYVPNMHGYDWEALRDRYAPLLEHVGHRSDLNYVISEMVAELSVSHAYIAGGDYEIPDRPDVALPGARFELDPDAGRYRIARILEGDNAEEKYRAPLTEIGIDVADGDYILAINGRDLTAERNPYELLRHEAGHTVTFLVNDQPRAEGAREVEFDPVSSETNLIYWNWVETNRARVDEATGGRVAYMHLPNMSSDGIYEFVKWFYGQIRKDGFIIDVRANGGGNTSAMFIERLSRELLALGYSRTSETATTYPRTVFTGPMVSILNETSASDGDIFPAMFRAAGLGPLIGKRSWGGVIGITSRGPLIDGGSVNVPEFGFASPEGEWIIEGYGVEPDIEVDNDPVSVLRGEDPQLERAIVEIQQRMRQQPAGLPPKPAGPDKTGG